MLRYQIHLENASAHLLGPSATRPALSAVTQFHAVEVRRVVIICIATH